MLCEKHLIYFGNVGDHFFGTKIRIDMPLAIFAKLFSQLFVLKQPSHTICKPYRVEGFY